MKRILVPLDFSPNAYKALNYAAEIAHKAMATIIIVNVVDGVDAPFRSPTALEKKHNLTAVLAVQEELILIKKNLEESMQLEVVTQFYAGAVTSSIIQSVEEHKADLVVMGTLGDAAVKERLFGSITAAVMGKALIPVFAIPLLSEWHIPKKILLAINHFDTDAGLAKIAFDLASLFEAKIIMATFTDELKASAFDYLESTRGILGYEDKLKDAFNEYNVESVKLYGPDFEDALDEYIDENYIDVLVMFTHKRTFIKSLFNRSMTKKMSYHTNIPLLAIPTK